MSQSVLATAILVGCLTTPAMSGEFKDGEFAVQSNLLAGVAKVDITPAETAGVETTGHRRIVHGVRDPLRAGVLVLDDGETKAAIVTLDTIFGINLKMLARRALNRDEPQVGVGLDQCCAELERFRL